MLSTWTCGIVGFGLPLAAAVTSGPDLALVAVAIGLGLNLLKLGRFAGRVEVRLEALEARLSNLETRRLQ